MIGEDADSQTSEAEQVFRRNLVKVLKRRGYSDEQIPRLVEKLLRHPVRLRMPTFDELDRMLD